MKREADLTTQSLLPPPSSTPLDYCPILKLYSLPHVHLWTHFSLSSNLALGWTIIFLLDRSLSHSQKPGNNVWIMFFDFSTAFDAIQSTLLRQLRKLEHMGLDHHLTLWILNFLTNHMQYVKIQDCTGQVGIPGHSGHCW